MLVDGDNARAGGVEGEGDDLVSGSAGLDEDGACGFDEGAHLIGVRLGGKVRVFASAVERVGCGGCSEAAAGAVEEGYADAEGTEVYTGNNGHRGKCLAEL